jgi:hypothetical protein
VAGRAPVKRNWFVQRTSGSRSVNRDLEAKALAGLKATSLTSRREWHPSEICRRGCDVTRRFALSNLSEPVSQINSIFPQLA